MLPNLRTRIVQGIGGHAYSKAVIVLVQLAAVPILLSHWGVQLYGEWLILTAISSQLALSDLGFASAAASDMGMRVAKGARNEALESYQSSWLMSSIVGAVVAVGFSALVWFAPVGTWFDLQLIEARHVKFILLCAGFSALVAMFTGLFQAGLQAIGRYGLAAFLGGLSVLTQFSVLAVVVLLGKGPVTAAWALVLVALAYFVLSWVVLKRIAPWLRVGISHGRWATIRRLFTPAMAFVGYSLGSNLLIVYGSRVVVGVTLGPAAVAVFATITTLTSAIRQAIDTINHIIRPELSLAFGAGDAALTRKLHHCACQVSLWLSIVALVPLGLGGQWILEVWTRGRLDVDMFFYGVQLAAVVIRMFWSTSAMTLTATNRHQRMAAVLLLTAVAGLALGAALSSQMGLVGVALGYVIIETFMLLYVVRSSLKLLGDQLENFVPTVARPPIWLVAFAFTIPFAKPAR